MSGKSTTGRYLRLSPGRRLVCDFLAASHPVPAVTMERRMNLTGVTTARQAVEGRPGWCAIFTKAYAGASAAHPEFRRVYVRYPWPRLYEYPYHQAGVVVERAIDGDSAILVTLLRTPEQQSLVVLDGHLRRFKGASLESVGAFRRALRMARRPAWLRRLLWWYGMNVSGRQRVRRLGTFGVSSVAGIGADTVRPLSPWTTLLHYGAIDAAGQAVVRVTFDHRVLDAAIVARVLTEMERILNKDLAAELRQRARREAA